MATVGGNMMQPHVVAIFTIRPCLATSARQAVVVGPLVDTIECMPYSVRLTSCIAVHPSDMCVALVVLDTKVVIASAKGERKINFIDFHRLAGTTPEKDNNLMKGELIVRLEIPVNNLNKNFPLLKS